MVNPGEKTEISRRGRGLPLPPGWIVERILAVGALAELNAEGRAAVHILVETGCRLSEVANLLPAQIRLDHPIPHIIAGSTKFWEGREIPLVGVALEAAKKFPAGFPRPVGKKAAWRPR